MPAYAGMFRQYFARDVYVMMSRAATRFVTPYSFELFTDHAVFCDTFDQGEGVKVPHIELCARADLFVIAPATANILGKCAAGICDELISTAVVACTAPVVFVPSMNEVMWRSKVVQRNVATLRELGHHVLEPARGLEIVDLEPSFGAIPPFQELVRSLRAVLAPGRNTRNTSRSKVSRSRSSRRTSARRRPSARRPGPRS
jgi:phosphopantothenoylcysteine synthetase/decarboxylase